MGEHYPESAIGEKVFAHCSVCGRTTEHVVVRHSEHAGKLGHCVDPKHPKSKMTKRQEKAAADEKRRRQNPELPF